MSKSEFDDVQRFIRLKRYEQPPEGFQEAFVAEFQRRQRAELLQRSSVGLFMERLGTYISGFGRQRLLVGAGLSYAAAMLIFFVVAREQRQPVPATASAPASSSNAVTPISSLFLPDVRLVDDPHPRALTADFPILPSGRQPIYQPRSVEPVRYETEDAEIVEF
jgi:hypothetical protein